MLAPATQIPKTIDAGTTVAYSRTYPDFPAGAGWALTLYLAGASVANVLATANADSFDVVLGAAATAALTPGAYTYLERVELAGEKYDVARGTVQVRADVATAAPGALQSWEERTLVVVEAALAGQLTDGIASYQIHSRAVNKIPADELLKIRNQLRSAIAQQKSGRFSTSVKVHFPGTGIEPWGERFRR